MQFADKLAFRLESLFNKISWSSGFEHPGESVIREALNENEKATVNWLKKNYDKFEDLIYCLPHLPKKYHKKWLFEIMKLGLKNKDLHINDGAVRGLEILGGRRAIKILKTYVPDKSWLDECVEIVINNLESDLSYGNSI